MDQRTRIFTRADLTRLMSAADYRDAVEFGFRASAAGDAHSPPPLHLPARNGGGFHAKAAALRRGARWFAAVKVNGNFPAIPRAACRPFKASSCCRTPRTERCWR
ncbi:MAG: hypothetical protein SFV19_09415 [Rhodospirillaceae bacterium]|nr:hypothetical protein [Rhodospirillaceae bacterium]